MNYTQFYKQATMNKIASDEQIYKVAALMKHAAMNKESASPLLAAGKAIYKSVAPAANRFIRKNVVIPGMRAYRKQDTSNKMQALLGNIKGSQDSLVNSVSGNLRAITKAPLLEDPKIMNLGYETSFGQGLKGLLRNMANLKQIKANRGILAAARKQLRRLLRPYLSNPYLNAGTKKELKAQYLSPMDSATFRDTFDVQRLANAYRSRFVNPLTYAGVGTGVTAAGVPLAVEAFDED